MPKIVSANGPAVLRFPNGRSISVDARMSVKLSFFPVSGEGEFTTDCDTASRAFLSGETLSLTFTGAEPVDIIVRETKSEDALAHCWFRVQS